MSSIFRGIVPATRNTAYIDALTPDSSTEVAIGATIINQFTGERLTLDLVLPDDRTPTVLRAIREHFSPEWGLFEAWEIEAMAPVEFFITA